MLRRMIVSLAVLATLVVAVLATAAAPANATTVGSQACPAVYPRPAYCDYPAQLRLAGLQHVGWVYLNLNYCPPGRYCAMVHTSTASAWSWTGSAWRQSSIRGGWVYAYPYTGSWRWAWTQQSGWVAMNSGRFEIRHW